MKLAALGGTLRLSRGGSAAPAAAGMPGVGGWAGGAATPRDDRHSRRVALLKRLLPAIGVGMLLLIAMWPRLAPVLDRIKLSFPAIDLRDARELQMLNPRYAGTDREGRPVVVTAASGRQIPDRQDLMSLREPRADVKTQGGTEIVVTAASGVYQAQAQLLDLFGDVTVVHQNGTRLVTQTARVDAAASTAQGSDPVAGQGPSGELKAQGFRILDRGETVMFTGKAEMVMRGARPTAATPARRPASALPAPVAAAAAQAEAEGRPLLKAAAGAAPRPARAVKPAAGTASAKKPASGAANAAAKPAARPKPPAAPNKT